VSGESRIREAAIRHAERLGRAVDVARIVDRGVVAVVYFTARDREGILEPVTLTDASGFWCVEDGE
jgi:hypothetical protein